MHHALFNLPSPGQLNESLSRLDRAAEKLKLSAVAPDGAAPTGLLQTKIVRFQGKVKTENGIPPPGFTI